MEKPMADRDPLALPPLCCMPVNDSDENATPCVKHDDDIGMDDCGRNEDEGRRREGHSQRSVQIHQAKTESSLIPPQSSARCSQTCPQTPSTPAMSAVSSIKSGPTTDNPASASLPAQTAASSQQSNGLESALLVVTNLKQGAQLPSQPEHWHEFCLPPPTFSEFRQQLEQDHLLNYFENQLRWDYNPERGALVLRPMASALHDTLEDGLRHIILKELDDIVSRGIPGISGMASKIMSSGHAKVGLDTINGHVAKKSPDIQLRYHGIIKPAFVVEIAWSQQTKPLKELVKEYFIQGNGGIKTILTVDIEYSRHENTAAAGTSRKAVYCLYRGPDRVHNNTPFRKPNGSPEPGTLQLVLADFIPDQVLQDVPKKLRGKVSNIFIDITHERFCEELDKAEKMQESEVKASELDKTKRIKPGQMPKKSMLLNWGDSDTDDHDDADGTDSSEHTEASPEPKRRRAWNDRKYCPSTSISSAKNTQSKALSSAENTRSKALSSAMHTRSKQAPALASFKSPCPEKAKRK